MNQLENQAPCFDPVKSLVALLEGAELLSLSTKSLCAAQSQLRKLLLRRETHEQQGAGGEGSDAALAPGQVSQLKFALASVEAVLVRRKALCPKPH